MESVSTNSELDNYIINTLKKNEGVDLQPIDWSEVDVLLYHEKKSVLTGIKINKKTILVSAAIIIPAIILLGAVKIVLYYSSVNSKKIETPSAPASNSFTIIDSDKNILTDSISKNSNPVDEKHRLDSISGNVLTDTSPAPTTPKQEKRKKGNTISPNPISDDTAVTKTDTTKSSVITTEPASTPAVEENNSTSPSSVDTISKDNSSQKKSSKRKNRRSQKTTDSVPAQTKPDSLKQ